MIRTHRLKCLVAWLLAAAAGAAAPANAADWPQWRGPNRDGVSRETGLLTSWKGAPPLVWKAGGLGRGFSSVSITAGRIYTMGDRNGQQLVIALDAASGKELWSAKVGLPWKDDSYQGPRCTPTVDGDAVYAVGTHGDLVCVDAATGVIRWRRILTRPYNGQMMSGWGYSESPLVDGDLLVCTPGGTEGALVAFYKHSGAEIWRAKVPDLGPKGVDGAAYSSMVVSTACGVRQYVQLLGRGLVGIAAHDGRFLWGYNQIANETANIATPIVRGDYVFASTGYETGAALLKLSRQGNGVEAKEVYFLPSQTLQNHHGGVVLVGDHLYCGTGHSAGFPICVEFLTGKPAWEGGRGPGQGSAAVTCADGQLYFRYENGLMALIAATPQGYNLKGTFKLPHSDQPSWAHPVVAGRRLYLREQGMLYCYDVAAR